MARRVSMPTADDLFRPTARSEDTPARPSEPSPAAREEQPSGPRQPSGRVRHDEKMTVYVTSEELLAVEQARLALRGSHGLPVDRGRLVREALAMALGDLEENGEQSRLVRRLRGE